MVPGRAIVGALCLLVCFPSPTTTSNGFWSVGVDSQTAGGQSCRGCTETVNDCPVGTFWVTPKTLPYYSCKLTSCTEWRRHCRRTLDAVRQSRLSWRKTLDWCHQFCRTTPQVTKACTAGDGKFLFQIRVFLAGEVDAVRSICAAFDMIDEAEHLFLRWGKADEQIKYYA